MKDATFIYLSYIYQESNIVQLPILAMIFSFDMYIVYDCVAYVLFRYGQFLWTRIRCNDFYNICTIPRIRGVTIKYYFVLNGKKIKLYNEINL